MQERSLPGALGIAYFYRGTNLSVLGANLHSQIAATCLIASGQPDGISKGAGEHAKQIGVVRIARGVRYGQVESEILLDSISARSDSVVNIVQSLPDLAHLLIGAPLGSQCGHLGLDAAAQLQNSHDTQSWISAIPA